MDGDADGPALIGYGARYGLADPPGSVSAELIALLVIEFLHGADKPDVPFLDKVRERHAPAAVSLGDANHKPQVRLDELLLRYL